MSTDFFQALPIVGLAYACQPVLFPMWQALVRPTVSRLNTANVGGITLCCVLYVLVGIAAYLAFGTSLKAEDNHGNVFYSFPNDNIFFSIVRLLFGVAIMFHYPLVHFAFRVSIEQLVFPKSKGYTFSWIRHTLETVVVVGVTLVLAILLTNLGSIFGLTGAIAAFPFCFILPGFFYLRLFGGLGRFSTRENSWYKDIDSESPLVQPDEKEDVEFEPERYKMLKISLSWVMLVLFGMVWFICVWSSLKSFLQNP